MATNINFNMPFWPVKNTNGTWFISPNLDVNLRMQINSKQFTWKNTYSSRKVELDFCYRIIFVNSGCNTEPNGLPTMTICSPCFSRLLILNMLSLAFTSPVDTQLCKENIERTFIPKPNNITLPFAVMPLPPCSCLEGIGMDTSGETITSDWIALHGV